MVRDFHSASAGSPRAKFSAAEKRLPTHLFAVRRWRLNAIGLLPRILKMIR